MIRAALAALALVAPAALAGDLAFVTSQNGNAVSVSDLARRVEQVLGGTSSVRRRLLRAGRLRQARGEPVDAEPSSPTNTQPTPAR